MTHFTCTVCNKDFEVAQSALEKYPNWTPRYCREHSPKKKSRPKGAQHQAVLTTAQVLARYTEGPSDGVFTDGSCVPNPGPGGWGVVVVKRGRAIAQAYGRMDDTTNNRMELFALIEAFTLLRREGITQKTVLYTDSRLCVDTINKWAGAWEKRGWTRKTGSIKNLELVKQLWNLFQSRPEVSLRWVQAHSGNRWNEYADALSTAWLRDTL